MLDLKKITDSLRDCPCGKKHEIHIRALEIEYAGYRPDPS